MNRDAGAVRSSSHMELRTMRRSARPTVDGEGVVNMLRRHVSVVAAVILRRKMIDAEALVVRDASRGVAADTDPMRRSQRRVPLGGAR